MKDTLKNMKWCSAKDVASGTVTVAIGTVIATALVALIDFVIVGVIKVVVDKLSGLGIFDKKEVVDPVTETIEVTE